MTSSHPTRVNREGVGARASGAGRFQQDILAAGHRLIVDEPVALGGLGAGPSPYDLLSAALAACSSMTIRLYADMKELVLPGFVVEVSHDRVHADDCSACLLGQDGRIDRFNVLIIFESAIDTSLQAKISEIAEKCPVHRSLASASAIITRIEAPGNE